MKKSQWILLCALIAIIGCTSEWNNRDYKFDQGFADLQVMEAKYNGSFKQEKLNGTIVPQEDIEPFLEELNAFQKNVEKTQDNKDKEALLKFIAIRKDMLLAEKNFQLAQNIGDIGIVIDKGGFSCGEAKYILDTSFYYNESFVAARRAMFNMDDLLYWYGNVSNLESTIGINKNKPAFYYSIVDHISKIMKTNEMALAQNCKIRVVTN